MKKLLIAFVLAVAPAIGAASEGAHLDKVDLDINDQASLQRGARLFVNYCQGCHSLKFQRYNRMAKDLGMTEDEVKENLMFVTDKIGEPMTTAMTEENGAAWFGNPPPDLSVITRARGADYIYTYLRSFYIDEKRPFGVNNAVFPDVGMPNVLWSLEGMKKAKIEEKEGVKVVEGYEQVSSGSMSKEEFDGAARDLTNFLAYVGEPAQLERQRLGPWVLIFIAIFFVLAYLLKKEYWKDVH